MVGGWFRVIFSVAKFIWVEVGVDGYSSSKRFGIETESWVEVFIKVYVTCYDKVLRLIRKVNYPAYGIVRESKEDVARDAMKLLFVGNKFVTESWFWAPPSFAFLRRMLEVLWTSRHLALHITFIS